jgi:hypothetical protein
MLYYHDSAILYYIYNNRMNGSIINVLEYFLCAYEHNPDIKLIFINGGEENYSHFIRTVEDRYDLSGLDGYKNNILLIPKKDLLRSRFGRVLIVDYGTIPQVKGLLSSKNTIVITEVLLDQTDFILNKSLYNCTYYGEMPFHYWNKRYRMKMLLSRMKPLRKVESAIYINSPHNHDFSFIDTLGLPNKPILLKERIHRNNLFELFDTYVYYHANKWFDPHPRLFVECSHYNKDIIYINNPGVLDGSFYRYNDVRINGTKGRNLTKEDEIIQQLI